MKKIFLAIILLLFFLPLTGSAVKVEVMDEIQTLLTKPETKIKIPGLNFTPAKEVAQLTTEEGGVTYLNIPYLGEYLAALYKYLVVAAGILAVVMIINHAFGWIVSGGSSEKISHAKKRILQSVAGLLIAVSSYTLLYAINPELVHFRNLKVAYIMSKSLPLYPEGDTTVFNEGVDPFYLTGKKMTIKEQCLMEKFALRPGEKPPLQKINMFNMVIIDVNTNSYNAWKKVSDEILSSSDPEIQGYLRYMKDFKNKKIYDLTGQQDGEGVISQLTGTVGISRHNKQPLKKITHDMHVNGLAVDFMTRSNWDINWGGTKKGDSAAAYCKVYQKTMEKMKTEYPDDPYKMYGRLEKNINDCLNKFANGTNPFTSLPQSMIDIFENNGFYWGGYGWGNKLRSDAMHFEYAGECSNI